MMHIEEFTFNAFQTRCCVIWDDNGNCAFIDPGASSDAERSRIRKFVADKGLKPVCIMLTHGHFDHILGTADLVRTYSIPVYMHPADKFTLESNEYFCRAFGAPLPEAFETIDVYGAAQAPEGAFTGIDVGGLHFDVIETPGHTKGGVCYLEASEKVLFSGDTLFAGAIGRTDHPGGDYDLLMKSIFEKVIILEGDINVIPGHGPCTDIATERMTNPFLLPFNEPYEED